MLRIMSSPDYHISLCHLIVHYLWSRQDLAQLELPHFIRHSIRAYKSN